MPSRICFTFPDRGFWAPSSMLVSNPKAAWEEGGAGSHRGTRGPEAHLVGGPGPGSDVCRAIDPSHGAAVAPSPPDVLRVK